MEYKLQVVKRFLAVESIAQKIRCAPQLSLEWVKRQDTKSPP